VANGVKLLKFVLEERVEDPSRVPDVLRPFEPIPADLIAQATVRHFRYERSGGMWVINGELVDIDKPMVSPPLGAPELWTLINNSGGWWHPVHTHLEFGRIISRNGMEPPLTGRDGIAKVDTVVLGPNDQAEVFFRFRDYPGPFVNHCHNLEHEDHAMMFRWDVVGHDSHDCFFRGR
jgi:FtsP/CotA-like multicopper oxidase with cupredoxin domain